MTTTPIRSKEEIMLLKQYFMQNNRYRDYTLFVMGINTALRISDLISLKWQDVYDTEKNTYLKHIMLKEQKTKKNTCIALNASCCEALDLFIQHYGKCMAGEYIFFSRNDRTKHIGRNRAYNIIKHAAEINRLEGNISCHSLRKTFGYHAWKTGTPPALIMEIYNHSNIEITKRYLSIDQDDKDALYEMLNL